MSILRHELKQGLKSFIIWCSSMGFLLAICIFLFPEMKGEMEGVTEMFGSMGSFTQAFGMDRLDFGTLIGYYAIECGNVLGLGGAFFASFVAVSALAKEEKEHTAEFLLTHPVSRNRVVTEKLLAVLVQIIAMNLIIWLLSVVSMAIIGETVPWKNVILLHLAYTFAQIEIGCICFGISAFLRRGSLGIGLAFAIIMYFLNIVSNLTSKVEFLKYITPFGYTDGADIITSGGFDSVMVLLGLAYATAAVVVAYLKYNKKDIQ